MIKRYTTDGEYILKDNNEQSNVRFNEKTTVIITDNPDSASIVFGTKDSSGNFKAFSEGVIFDDDVINHGKGCVLVADITGISTYVEISIN